MHELDKLTYITFDIDSKFKNNRLSRFCAIVDQRYFYKETEGRGDIASEDRMFVIFRSKEMTSNNDNDNDNSESLYLNNC